MPKRRLAALFTVGLALAACNPSSTLTIGTTGDGTTEPPAGKHEYVAGTTLRVKAVPGTGATFEGWTGAATGNSTSITLLLDGDKSITAHFGTGHGSSSGGSSSSGGGSSSSGSSGSASSSSSSSGGTSSSSSSSSSSSGGGHSSSSSSSGGSTSSSSGSSSGGHSSSSSSSGGASSSSSGGSSSSSGGPVACDWSDPPANVAAWVNESWNAQLTGNIHGREAWLLDDLMKGHGTINVCVRWGATAQLTAGQRDRIAGALQTWLNGWFEHLKGYGCFPYPQGVTVKLTGFAVKPGQESLLGWTDRTVPVYTGTDGEGEPQCPDACSSFVHWDHSFAGCPGGEQHHFDYSLWLDDAIGGGAAAVGGDWGLRMPRSDFIGALGRTEDNTIQHEMGHGFGIQDYYDWTGSTPAGGSIMIVGSAWGGPTTADAWLLRRVWKEQKALRGW